MVIKENEIIDFLKRNVEPLKEENFGDGYRASVYLTDGTFLPCVIFRNSKKIIELAKRRFKEEIKGRGKMRNFPEGGYNAIVKSFVAHGNCINAYNIAKVEISKYAFTLSVIEQIHGETVMGLTVFAAKMKDGKYFGFRTDFGFEFFDMPENYSVEDIVKIIDHSFVMPNGELRTRKYGVYDLPEGFKDAVTYQARPFFECYLDNL